MYVYSIPEYEKENQNVDIVDSNDGPKSLQNKNQSNTNTEMNESRLVRFRFRQTYPNGGRRSVDSDRRQMQIQADNRETRTEVDEEHIEEHRQMQARRFM
ncbi:hypothetical protein Tco_0949135 [Tanacetum coccineum]